MVERRPYKADATSSSLVPPTRNLRDLRNKRRKSLFLSAVSEEMVDAFLKFRRNSQEPPQVWSTPAKKRKGVIFSLSCGDKTATSHDGAFLFQYHPQHVNKKSPRPLEGHTAVPPSPRQKGPPSERNLLRSPYGQCQPPHLALPNISPVAPPHEQPKRALGEPTAHLGLFPLSEEPRAEKRQAGSFPPIVSSVRRA